MTPLTRRIVAVYIVLAVAEFAFPGGLVSWLDDRNRTGWLDAPLSAARAIDAASAALGVKGIGQRLRGAFASAIGEDAG